MDKHIQKKKYYIHQVISEHSGYGPFPVKVKRGQNTNYNYDVFRLESY